MASIVRSIDGISIRIWKNKHGSKNPPRGYLFLVHGLGEHSGRYENLADFMTGFGWDIVAPDLPGHGLTEQNGEGGDILLSPSEVVQKLDALVGSVLSLEDLGDRSYFLKAPKILVGHSMGALISALWLCSDKPPCDGFEWKAAFLSAPPIQLKVKVPKWKLGLAKLLKSAAPNLKIGNEISPKDLSVDVVNQAEYKADKLVHTKASARLFWGMQEAAERVMDRAKMIEVPVCLAVAKNDPIVDATGVRAFFDQINSHKRYLEFPLSRHEIFNDVEKIVVYESLLKWCAKT